MSTTTDLHTTRLHLRRPNQDDSQAIIAACQDADIQRVIGHSGEYTTAHATAYLANCVDGWTTGTRHTWAITNHNRFIGQVSLTHTSSIEATIGYWLTLAHRGHGYLPEAANRLLDHALDPVGMNLHIIRWNAYAGNLASANVARKLGFRYTTTARLGTLHWNRQRDAWVAYLHRGDDRTPQSWPVMEPAHP